MVSEIVLAINNLILQQIICLVDILAVEIDKLQRLPIYRNQILKADVIVFTKCDLVAEIATEKRLIEKFKSLYPGKTCFKKRADYDFWISLIYGDNLEKQADQFRMVLPFNRQLTDSNYQSYTYFFNPDTILSYHKLVSLLQNHPEIIRAKGYLNTDQGWLLFNFTLSGNQFESSRFRAQSELIIITEQSDSTPEKDFRSKFLEAILSNSSLSSQKNNILKS